MAEKKTTKTAVKKTTTATAAKKAPATKKATAAKKEVLYLNEENAGFKAGDVYQALYTCRTICSNLRPFSPA